MPFTLPSDGLHTWGTRGISAGCISGC